MQSFRIAPARHHAARELVDDDDLAALDDVILVTLKQLVRLQRLIDVVHQRHVIDVVQRALHHACGVEELFHLLVTGIGQRHLPLFFIEFKVGRFESFHQLIDGLIEIGAIFERTRNDQRRAGLVDQDRVDFVDDGVGVPALNHIVLAHLHVVAQVVEAEFVICRVGHVARVRFFAIFIRHVMNDDADRQTEKAVDLSHPFAVALGEIIVDRHDMNAFTGKRVQINGQGRDERFTFAGLHLGDVALMQDHTADQLHIEMPLTERTPGRLADCRECRHHDVVERRTIFQLLTEGLGTAAQLLIGELFDFRLEGVDRSGIGPENFDATVV